METLLHEWLPSDLVNIIDSYLQFYRRCIRSTNLITSVWDLQALGTGQFLCETHGHLATWDPKTEKSILLTGAFCGSFASQNHNIWIKNYKTLKRLDTITQTFNMEIVMGEDIHEFIILDDRRLLLSFPNAWILITCNQDAYTICKLKTQMEYFGSVIALDDMRVAHTSDNYNVGIWNLVTGEMVRELKGHSHISTMRYLGHQKLVVVSYDNTIKIWNLTTGECEMTLQQDVLIVDAMVSDHRLFTNSTDCQIRVWDMRTKRCELLPGEYISFFFHDGYLVTHSHNNIKFWV